MKLSTSKAAVAAAVFGCAIAAPFAFAELPHHASALPAAGTSTTTGATVVPVSGTSALSPTCGQAAANGNVLNPNTEVQPMVARDPKQPSHLVAIYQQDRWKQLGSNGAVTVVSNDSGATWHRSADQPAFSHCNGGTTANGGDYDVTTDQWITITPSGAAVAISFSLSGDGTTTAMLVSRSSDGGEHWAAPKTLKRDDTAEFFNDRPSITADPYHPGTVYAVWDRIDDTSTSTTENYIQPIWMAKSTDDGLTWTTAKQVYDVPTNSGILGPVVTPMDAHTLLIGMHYETDTTGAAQVIRSTDGGATWSKPTLNAPAPRVNTPQIPNPDKSGDAVRNATLPLLAAWPGTTVVNAVWPNTAADGTFHVTYAQSTDDGQTWSSPVRVDKTPTGSAAVPAIATSSNGTVAVTYYDFRNNTTAAGLPTDLWAITCTATCTASASWHEQHIQGPFDAQTVPLTSSGRMLGDYTGLTSTGTAFVDLYGVATGNTTNPTDIHSATFHN